MQECRLRGLIRKFVGRFMNWKNKLKFLNNDYVLNVATKISLVLIGVVTSMFSTRYLGVINKGTYSYIYQIAHISVTLLNLGIYQSYSYNYKKFGKETLKKYSDIFFLQFLIYTLIAVTLAFIVKDVRIVLAVLLVPFNLIKLQYENIMIIENMRARMFIHIFDKILLTVCYALLYFFVRSDVTYFVLLTILIDAFTVIFYLLKLKYVPKFWQVDFKFLKGVIKFGFIPMLSLFLVTVNYSIDVLFLEKLGTELELGYYSFATTIINYVWLLPDAFKEVLFSKSAKKLDRKSISLTTQISLLSIVCCFVGFLLFGKLLIRIFYGEAFIPSYGVILILILGAFSMSIFKLLGIVLVSQGKRNMHFLSLVVSAIMNIGVNIWAIPKWGMYGAAWASVLSYTSCAMILLPYFCRLFNFNLSELFIPSKTSINAIKKKVLKR